jgi:hypothetical protein
VKTIYNLLHFANKTPKHLRISIPDTVPDLTKEEGAVLFISSEGDSHSFALSSSEINDFILALTYARDMLHLRRIAAITQKYFRKEEKKCQK